MTELLSGPIREDDVDQVLETIESFSAPRKHHEGRDMLPSELLLGSVELIAVEPEQSEAN